MIDPLSRLAIRHGTDKFGYHDYTPNYHKLFERFRDRPVKVLEIGVGGYQDEDRGGQSLATWRDYFPQAEITGIDIQKKSLDLGPRVQILQGSQIDAAFLARLVAERGPFDLIIDDGSHRNEHVVESYRLLWPTLVPGGIYVVEDVQTAFMPRFGGSLSLDQPNSVGHFANILARMDSATDDPLIDDVGAIERFHNMVALHKINPSVPRPGWESSNAFEPLAGLAVSIATNGLPMPKGNLGAKRLSSTSGSAAPDIALVDAATATPASVEAAVAGLAMPGFAIISGRPDAALTDWLVARFVEVDHREIAVGFPRAEVGPLAQEIRSVERHADGVVIVKAPNDYPSNFAFDADHPQAAEAIAQIEEVLKDCDEENGLVQFASMLTNTRGREAAAPWLERLGRIGATSRVYFQLASGLAQREKRLADAAALLGVALERFPCDPLFSVNRGGVLLQLGHLDEAAAVVDAALERAPRDTNLMIQRARIAVRAGDIDLAVAQARRAVELSAPQRRDAAKIALSEMLVAAGLLHEPLTILGEIAGTNSRYAEKAGRLLGALLDAPDTSKPAEDDETQPALLADPSRRAAS
ncbi:MAG: hypothetical protein GC146_13985 [Limimaricola sp.]|uniref:class I SAM-dependent methyltransferase n=1 Tax=Limimaricola sp. TaxID=2211665 RepID=UPI001DE199C0|nr:class I SAM-dependent methyltransferase [Limimaricola sp.]MBI1418326.1 hypothetical protein [Limimaricola sp.]